MRRLVDAARQPRHDDKIRLAEIARQGACKFQPGAGGIARADHREHRPHQRVKRAAHAEQRRRIVQRGQPRRIAGFIRGEQADADPLTGRQFGMRVLLAADPPRTIGAAAPRKVRQPLQRDAGAAEMINQ